MKQQNYLFVGGHQDGQIHSLPEARPEMQYPVFTPLKFKPFKEISPVAPAPRIERYFLEQLCAKEDYFLYRHESLTIDDVLKKLLAGYKPKAS